MWKPTTVEFLPHLLEPIVAGPLLLGLGLEVPRGLAVELLQLLVRLVAEGGGHVAKDGVHSLEDQL